MPRRDLADPSHQMPDRKNNSKSSVFHRHATFIWVVYWIVLTCLLHWPKLALPPIAIKRSDIVAHFTTFAILTGLCVFARRVRNRFSRRDVLSWAGILLAFSGISELLQPLSHRSCDPLDFAANAAGIVVVMLIVLKKRLFSSPAP